jgi:SNF2 family DNA or RNA helicase
LKNPLTYWGVGAALLGCHEQRIICATGTPFNNGAQDMAALMSYIEVIDPRIKKAKKTFWEDATAHGAADSILEALKSWQGKDHEPRYILRRDKSLVVDLPSKAQTTTPLR